MLLAQATVAREVLVLAFTAVAHVVGAAALVYTLLHADDDVTHEWWPRDDGDGPPRAVPPAPTSPSGDPLPLPVSEPAGARLRTPARLGDAYPRPPRRAPHPDPRTPVPTPTRDGH